MDSSAAVNPETSPQFQGAIQPTKVSGLYKAGLALVAILMVLLPAVYVGLIVGAGYAVYDHAVSHSGLLGQGGGGLLLYFGPIVIGVVLVVFMIKPLFARAPKKSAPYSIKPEDEPVLFAFIAQICRQVRAPLPRRVDVDCQVNASASFRRGWWSIFGDDLVLTIGLPLVSGFSQRQFAGVLAHEFGHFAQGGGMRLTYIIRTVSFWFARVVYERDSWDESLAEASKQVDIRVGIILYAARFCVWVTRKILWALMMLGHLISCFMLRQMEFDADSYETKLAGSEHFAATARRLQELNVASQIAWNNLHQTWQDKRLPDNLPVFITCKVAEITSELREKIEQDHASSKTGWLDTHPCDTERIARAQALRQPGIFHADRPASELFRDFPALARAATQHQYRQVLPDEFKPELLVSTDESLQESASMNEGYQAADRLWLGLFNPARPLVLAEHQLMPLPDPGLSLVRFQQRREQMRNAAENIRKTTQQFNELLGKKRLAEFVRDLQSAHFTVEEKLYAISGKSGAESLTTHLAALDPHQLVVQQMAGYEAIARERLIATLQLLQRPDLLEQLQAPGIVEEVRGLARILGPLAELMPAVAELDRVSETLQSMLDGCQNEAAAKYITPQIERLALQATRQIGEVDQRLGGLAYPFKHAKGSLSVIEYARSDTRHEHQAVMMMLESKSYSERLVHLYGRIIGCLAVIAEKVEGQSFVPLAGNPQVGDSQTPA